MNRPKAYQKGSEVEIHYNPSNPKQYDLKNDRHYKKVVTVTTVIGILFLITGISVLFVLK